MSVEMSWALDIMTGARIEIDSPGPTGLAHSQRVRIEWQSGLGGGKPIVAELLAD